MDPRELIWQLSETYATKFFQAQRSRRALNTSKTMNEMLSDMSAEAAELAKTYEDVNLKRAADAVSDVLYVMAEEPEEKLLCNCSYKYGILRNALSVYGDECKADLQEM